MARIVQFRHPGSHPGSVPDSSHNADFCPLWFPICFPIATGNAHHVTDHHPDTPKRSPAHHPDHATGGLRQSPFRRVIGIAAGDQLTNHGGVEIAVIHETRRSKPG